MFGLFLKLFILSAVGVLIVYLVSWRLYSKVGKSARKKYKEVRTEMNKEDNDDEL